VLSAQPVAQALPGWACAASPESVARSLHGACPLLLSMLASPSSCGESAFANTTAEGRTAHASSPWQSWHLYDRPAARTWVQGRVALLGDAAHPMLPYLAQGAAMALEDATVLASSVAMHSDWHSALLHYQLQRKARCERVVATARRNGRIFHLAPPWSLARNAALTVKGTEVLGMPWLYGARVGST
jgi:2-polyprenyl-6-methoxyphenol hydroxylase-like FAD-dependent oxidoreductase